MSCHQVFHPPWNFPYRIATVKLGKMVRFNPLVEGYLPSVNACNFIEDLGVTDSIEISCTALSTSQLRVLGTAILEWDMFSLDEGKRMETDGNKMKQSDFQDLSSIFHQSRKSKRLTLNTWSKRAL